MTRHTPDQAELGCSAMLAGPPRGGLLVCKTHKRLPACERVRYDLPPIARERKGWREWGLLLVL
jgi:hypothetical protein